MAFAAGRPAEGAGAHAQKPVGTDGSKAFPRGAGSLTSTLPSALPWFRPGETRAAEPASEDKEAGLVVGKEKRTDMRGRRTSSRVLQGARALRRPLSTRRVERGGESSVRVMDRVSAAETPAPTEEEAQPPDGREGGRGQEGGTPQSTAHTCPLCRGAVTGVVQVWG